MCEPAYDENGKIIGIACPNAAGHRGPEGPTGGEAVTIEHRTGEVTPEHMRTLEENARAVQHDLPIRATCCECGNERMIDPNATSTPCSCGSSEIKVEALLGVVTPPEPHAA